MPQLDTLTLGVKDPDAQRHFYRDVLEMSDLGDGRIGYAQAEVTLNFVQASGAYISQPADLYWKIAISVPDIDLAFEQLTAGGHECSPPRQFRDVGHLAKLTDPEGFTVELLDHWFKDERPASADMDPNKLGGGPHISLVTLRTDDIARVEPDLLSFGMTLVSVQPVTPHGFTLYFYSFADELPPDSDLKAIQNRTWVYQRRTTLLEIQEVHTLESVAVPNQGNAGYMGLTLGGVEGDGASDLLRINAKS